MCHWVLVLSTECFQVPTSLFYFSVVLLLWSTAEINVMQTTSRAQAPVTPDLPGPFNHSDHNCKISFFSWQDQQVLQGYEVDENALPMGQYEWISSWIFSWGKYGVWEAKQLIPLVSSRDQFSHSHKSVLQKSLSAMCFSVGMWLVMSLNKFWRILFLPQIKNHNFDYTFLLRGCWTMIAQS